MIGNGDTTILPIFIRKRIEIEIHWRLNPGPARNQILMNYGKEKEKFTYKLSSLFFWEEKICSYFLLSHGARHGWSRLRWLVDIHQIVKKNLIGKIHKLIKEISISSYRWTSIILILTVIKHYINEEMKLLTRKSSKEISPGSYILFGKNGEFTYRPCSR